MSYRFYSLLAFLLFVSFMSSAQTIKQFSGHFTILEITYLGPSEYSIRGNFADGSFTFSASDAMVGDRILDLSGSTYEIITIGINGSEISATTKSLEDVNPKLGAGIIYRPTEKGFPLITLETPGTVLFNALNTATISIDASIPKNSSGSTLPVNSQKVGDVVLLSTENRLYRLTFTGWSQVVESEISYDYSSPITNAPPGNIGDLIKSYWDDKVYVFNGSTWVAPSEISSLPTPAKFGDVFYVTTEKKLYMMDDEGSWTNISSASFLAEQKKICQMHQSQVTYSSIPIRIPCICMISTPFG